MQPQLFIDIALKAWDTQISRADKLFSSLTDEELLKELASGKNRVLYLLGHLIAVNDNMIKLYGLGERSYSAYDEPFVKNPDRATADTHTVAELRDAWKRSNEQLSQLFAKMSPADWFDKHTAMTEEDLKKEPSRNKLSVLLNRTSHVAYHLGQAVLVKK